MTQPIIEVDNLSKLYHIGHLKNGQQSMGRLMLGAVTTPFKRVASLLSGHAYATSDMEEPLWALKDVNFKINQGEVVGIIGRNGAGKSTLLKVLSRIIEPTTGRVVIRGRIGSLLEVGTGFHPDLTGRENVYLNGSMLGMSRKEIQRKFDEIVTFSEVEKFIDTPVKHYSSGMYVRLAFAVAAHLEPEVLVVDEVLAVGDVNFQRKCIGKMNDVAGHGRTVLFVSHSMDTILSLCQKVVFMKDGQNTQPLSAEEGVRLYLGEGMVQSKPLPLRERSRFQHKDRPPVFTRLSITDGDGHSNVVRTGGSVDFEIEMEGLTDFKDVEVGVIVLNEKRQRVVSFHSQYQCNQRYIGKEKVVVHCHVPHLPLVPANYIIELAVADGYQIIERVDDAGRMEVMFADMFDSGRVPSSAQGCVVLPCEWGQRS